MNRKVAFAFAMALALTCPVWPVTQTEVLSQYPLRVHIFIVESTQHYSGGALSNSQVAGLQVDPRQRLNLGASGKGAANLYENSTPRGFDFSFDCSTGLVSQSGGLTVPARWIDRDKKLELLTSFDPVKGETQTCRLTTRMGDFAYQKHDHQLVAKSIEDRKQWMRDHDYDPEHGKEDIKPSRSGKAKD